MRTLNARNLLLCSTALVFAVAMSAVPASAQQASPAPPGTVAETESSDDLGLDEIVVTAVSGGVSKFRSSVSVSDLSLEELENFAPRSTAELFRNIPGIRSESSGGDNNANIQVRGLPVTTGGAKFVQLQEDGLPVLSFGDITFGNADNYLRADYNIARVEAIRGGSASTFASNAPGAVINFISRTGEQESGDIAVTRGVDFDTTRVDINYGAPISETLFFNVGGFYRVGEGARETGFNAENGGQIKANITKVFDQGFVRFYFKHLNDRAIPYLPAPVDLSSGRARPIPGFDFRDQTLATGNLLTNTRIDSGQLNTTNIRDGVRTISTSIGAEGEFNLPGGWKISDKVRYSDNRGGFVGTFTGDVLNAATTAAQFGGTSLRYANGPNAGQTLTNLPNLNGNGLIINNLLFDVRVNDLSQFVNDLKLTKTFDFAGGEVNVTGGYYKSVQQVETTWSFNFYLQDALGSNAALIDVIGANGQSRSVNGVRAFGIFDPYFDLTYDRDALYSSVSWAGEKLSLDGSFRYDDLLGRGASNLGAPAGSPLGGFLARNIDVNGDGVITPAETNIGTVDRTDLFAINYNVDYFSYSFGANYVLTPELAVFGRYSRGGVGNGDRVVLGGSGFNASGGLIDDGIAVDIVRQAELGLKYREENGFIPGRFSAFLTGFYANAEESNFEVTSGRSFDRTTRGLGFELEGSYRLGGFSLSSGLTYTNSRIRRDAINAGNVGNTPRRQAAVIYQVTPAYELFGHVFGANIVGTTSSYAQDSNVLKLPGFAQINLFANFRLTEGLVFAVNSNNVTNAFGLTEAEEGVLPANGIVRGRPINGRTTSVALRYSF